jgi:AraC-like DNA-binding protein
MDALSEILNIVKLNGAVFFSAEFSAPWGVTEPAASKLAVLFGTGAQHMVLYHFLIDGRAYVQMPDHQTLELIPGDIVIFPHGGTHHLTSARAAVAPFPNYGINAKIMARGLKPLQAGGGGDISRFVCGYLTCDPSLCKPILNGLPPVFKVNIRTDRSGQWMENSLLHAVQEAATGRAGSEAMLAKLSEALFVDTLRRYIDGLPLDQMGWLAGTRDAIVGKSLGLLHSRIAHAWTISDLADEVGISRSALTERFTRFLSEPPMTYLTRWRLQLAARSLEKTSHGIAEIAANVGYESEAAFNRAFKRQFGWPPARYRREMKVVEQAARSMAPDESAFSSVSSV